MKTRATYDEVMDALNTILSDHKSYSTSLNYAVNYTRYGAGLPDGEELRVQCLYILNNISRWRHDKSKQVRETLKSYSKR